MAYDHISYMRKYNETHKEIAKIKAAEFRKKNAARVLVQQKHKLCKQAGIPCSLTEADLLPLPTECPILGMSLNYLGGKMTDATATIDRISPDGGYVAGNVRVISMLANRIKSNATAWQLERVLSYMKGEI